MREEFSTYHPLVNFLYFTLVLTFAMVYINPVCLAISLSCGVAYSVYINRKKAVRFSLIYMLPTLIITALINPAFNHAGATVLTYLPSGNPLTKESVVYGIAAAVMLISVISWFSCFNAVITSDKLIYLFGRVIPALSLILSMSLRFVPRFKAQIRVISDAQRCIGRSASNGSLLSRAKCGIRILSIMVTWALENAIETADSMKSRAYGLPGRTAFSIYRFDGRDARALAFLLFCGVYIVTGASLGGLYFRYFPTINGSLTGIYSLSIYAVYFMLGIMPVAINIREAGVWKALISED